jgi:hypothetical protein
VNKKLGRTLQLDRTTIRALSQRHLLDVAGGKIPGTHDH